jgi:hypothetical protein
MYINPIMYAGEWAGCVGVGCGERELGISEIPTKGSKMYIQYMVVIYL